jgi:hypothetical protein
MDAIRAWAILNSGATCHFLTTATPMTNMRPTNKPIIARLPNGKCIHSTQTCTLDIPALPALAQQAHIIPGLAAHSLISVVTLCNAGCNVAFTKIGYTITYCGKIILCGSKCTRTGLWIIPLCPTPPSTASNNHANPLPTVIAANVDATSSASEYARYIHQALCFPLAATLIQALKCSRKLQPSLASRHILSTTSCFIQQPLIRAT